MWPKYYNYTIATVALAYATSSPFKHGDSMSGGLQVPRKVVVV